MDLSERIDRHHAYLILGVFLVILLLLGIILGKLVFWDKYDTRSAQEKELLRFRNEVMLNGEDSVNHLNLGWAYFKLGRIKDAEDEYRTALELSPEHVGVNYNLATVLLAQGNPVEGEVFFRKVIALDAEHFLALLGLGESLREQKKFPEAEKVLLQALALDPMVADPLNQLALVYEQWGKPDQARIFYKKAVDLIPDYQEANAGLKRLGGEGINNEN